MPLSWNEIKHRTIAFSNEWKEETREDAEALHRLPDTHPQARLLIHDYIDSFYNTHRLHSSLEFQSPLDFERSLIQSLN